MEERVNFRRTISAVALAIITYIFSGLLCYRGGLYTDEWICVFFVDTIFLMCFVYELESERLAKLLSNNINTNFSRVVVAYFFVFVITFLISYAPVYFKPVMILPVIICSVSNETVGIIIGMFLNILLSGRFSERIMLRSAPVKPSAFIPKDCRRATMFLFTKPP